MLSGLNQALGSVTPSITLSKGGGGERRLHAIRIQRRERRIKFHEKEGGGGKMEEMSWLVVLCLIEAAGFVRSQIGGKLPPPHFTSEAKEMCWWGGGLPKVVVCTRSASLFLFHHKCT